MYQNDRAYSSKTNDHKEVFKLLRHSILSHFSVPRFLISGGKYFSNGAIVSKYALRQVMKPLSYFYLDDVRNFYAMLTRDKEISNHLNFTVLGKSHNH